MKASLQNQESNLLTILKTVINKMPDKTAIIDASGIKYTYLWSSV